MVLALSFLLHERLHTAALIVALFAGCVATALVGWRQLRAPGKALAEGSTGALVAIGNTAAVVGFGAVAKSAPAFALTVDWITHLPGGGIVNAAIAVSLIAAMTGSASGGQAIALPILAPLYLLGQGVDAAQLHRSVALASGALDAMPHNGCYIVTTIRAICGETHKAAYWPMAAMTMAVPTLGLVICLVLFSLGSDPPAAGRARRRHAASWFVRRRAGAIRHFVLNGTTRPVAAPVQQPAAGHDFRPIPLVLTEHCMMHRAYDELSASERNGQPGVEIPQGAQRRHRLAGAAGRAGPPALPMYGYQIAKQLDQHGEGVLSGKQSALYPVLRNLCAAGLLDSEVEPSVSGRRAATTASRLGRQVLRDWRLTWTPPATFVDTVLEGPPAMTTPRSIDDYLAQLRTACAGPIRP